MFSQLKLKCDLIVSGSTGFLNLFRKISSEKELRWSQAMYAFVRSVINGQSNNFHQNCDPLSHQYQLK